MQAPARAPIPLPRLPAHVLAPDLPNGLPRPPARSQSPALPIPRFGSGSPAELAQSPPQPALHRAQVPQDRSPSAPPESQPARAIARGLFLPARRVRDLRGATQYSTAEHSGPDRDQESIRRLGRVRDDPSSREDDSLPPEGEGRG